MRAHSFLPILLIILTIRTASADVSISFTAGAFRQADETTVPIGSLGLLVADTAGNGFGTSSSMVGSTLSIGSSLGGSDNLILAIFTASNLGEGTIGFTGSVDYSSSTLSEGTLLMVYWFPTITTTGVTLQTGVNYGSYRSDTKDTASGSNMAFVAPTDGTNPNLWVFDNVTNPGAVATPADLTALSYTAIPEPTSLALLATGGLLVTGTVLRRRRKVA